MEGKIILVILGHFLASLHILQRKGSWKIEVELTELSKEFKLVISNTQVLIFQWTRWKKFQDFVSFSTSIIIE